jgi:predicted DNA-binding antitoxin AbrB/MazE fold protein
MQALYENRIMKPIRIVLKEGRMIKSGNQKVNLMKRNYIHV